MPSDRTHALAVLILGTALSALAAACGGSSVPSDSGVIPCQTLADCPSGWACQGGVCIPPGDGGCVFDADCEAGQVCREGRCVAEPSDGGDGEDGGGDQPPPVPAIGVEPEWVDFGNARIGQLVELPLTLRSVGTGPLTVLSVQLETGTGPEFDLSPSGTLNEVLPPGGSLELAVRYRPLDSSIDTGAVLIACNDPARALVRVALSSSYKGSSEIAVLDAPAGGAEVDSLAFGAVPVGSSARRNLTVRNLGTGNAVLAVTEVRTEPLTSSAFHLSLRPAVPAYLSPDPGPCSQDAECGEGNTCAAGACLAPTGEVLDALTIEVEFAPGAVGAVAEQLIIANDEGDAGGDGNERILVLALGGEGVEPLLVVEPDPIDFGGLFVGQSAEQPVTLRNTGGQAVAIAELRLANGAPFALTPPAGSGWDLPPDGSLEFTLGYAPQAPGAHQDALEILSDAPGNPMQVDVLGHAALPPDIEVEPLAVAFGEVQLGSVEVRSFQVHNHGGGALLVRELALVGPAAGFGLVQQALPQIDPGASSRVDVTFAPGTALGPAVDRVRLTSDDPDSGEVFVDLSAVGTDPQVLVTPSTMDFGSVYVGSTAAPRTLTVRNIGSGTLTISHLRLTAGTGADFSLADVPVLPAQLGNGQSLTATVGFSPGGVGPLSGAIEVLTDDRDVPQVIVALDGIGSTCPEGWGDANGDPSDGCECPLTNGGVEDCDGQDNDCDALTDEMGDTRACSIQNAFGTCWGTESCDGANGWVGCSAATPALEECDGADNNCDGDVDAADADLVLAACPLQLGVCAGATHDRFQCSGSGWLPCVDTDYGPFYGAEICDGRDNDCNGDTDAQDIGLQLAPCDQQTGACAGATHRPDQCQGGLWLTCDASNYGTDPDWGQEICDTADNDCDGLVDTADGSLLVPDCPLQLGVCAGSRHALSECVSGGWQPCVDADYGSYYGAEICDGRDNDCNGDADAVDSGLLLSPCESQAGACASSLHRPAQCQGGGWLACDGTNYDDNPAFGAEVCDTVDNDCDTLVDTADPELDIPLCAMQYGVCEGSAHNRAECVGGSWQPCTDADYEAYNPGYDATELCDNQDNNCDGATDEGLSTRSCSVSNGFGQCFGTETCAGAAGWINCTAATPQAETCDGADNNCDGDTDALDPDLVRPDCEDQDGVCAGALHARERCVGGGWQLCNADDYRTHDPAYGVEVCGNALDEDCSGAANDRDIDGDGHRDPECGGDDCDDWNPLTYPGATEIQDAADNDCDGLVDEGLIPAGAVIVTEMMFDPEGSATYPVADTVGEWFELTNVSGLTVNLRSWRFRDLNTTPDQFQVTVDVVLGPGERAVLCNNANTSLNGGVECDFDYDNFNLAQSSGEDEIIATLDGFEIDRVVYPAASVPSRHSVNLDPSAYSASANDNLANWCSTPTNDAYKLDSGDWGTPGELNPSCSGALALLSITPARGIEGGGETVVLTGAGYDGTVTVTIGGGACAPVTVLSDTQLACVTPAHASGDVDVTVTKGPADQTLTDGYRYIGEGALNISWCDLQYPQTTSVPVDVFTPLLFGRVYSAGVTEPAGQPSGIAAELGYGPQGSDPRTTPGWSWVTTAYNPSCPDCGNNDEFMAQLKLGTAGTYSTAYRFSDDGGFRFMFCDFDPGTGDGFSTADLGVLIVTP